MRTVDDLPVLNAVPVASAGGPRRETLSETPAWWQRVLNAVRDEARNLVRVSRIDQPEAVLLAPDQAYFLRENLKLKLLNARLGLLARQTASARSDVAAAISALNRYFDPASRRTQAAATQLQQLQAQLRAVDLPPIDETLAVLATVGGLR
jgi:uroporphyrin-3 C-methyltransferase